MRSAGLQNPQFAGAVRALPSRALLPDLHDNVNIRVVCVTAPSSVYAVPAWVCAEVKGQVLVEK